MESLKSYHSNGVAERRGGMSCPPDVTRGLV